MATTTKAPKKSAANDLPKSVFAVEVPNHELLKLAYDSYLANGRVATATTKTRGLVSGGGKKPWRQKGTGRARFGSTRNPIWRHGGVVFGPLGIENYTKRVSKQAKHVALRQALTLAAQANKISIIDSIPSSGKTKDVASYLESNNLNVRRVLLVTDEKTPELIRSTRNLQNVLLIRPQYLNVYRILNADKIAMTQKSVEAIEKWLSKEVK